MLNIGYFAKNTGAVSEPWKLSALDVMKKTGSNTGNLAFWYAAKKLIQGKHFLINSLADARRLKKNIDIFVIPASNQLNGNADLGGLADIVEELDKPCLLVGIGAQADSGSDSVYLPEGTVRFLKEVSKRTSKIISRGDFTTKIIKECGVDNVASLGCSTIFINPDPFLGSKIESKWLDEIVRINIASGHIKDSHSELESLLVSLVGSFEAGDYTIQHPAILFRAFIQDTLSGQERASFERAAFNFHPERDPDKALYFLKAHARYYLDIDTWINSLRGSSFSLGTRIHGTVLAIQAEVPSVCITSDTRTEELCKVLRIPNIGMRDVIAMSRGSIEIEDIRRRCSIVGNEFDDNRKRLASLYCGVIKDLGVSPSENLRTLEG